MTYVLVPTEPTEEMLKAPDWASLSIPYNTYVTMLAARPPIPRATWDAMVERGARTVAAAQPWPNAWDRASGAQQDQWRREVGFALRAALPGIKVEGDAP